MKGCRCTCALVMESRWTTHVRCTYAGVPCPAGASCPGAPGNGLSACEASPGAFCPAGDDDNVPDTCPQGQYCDGGSAQPKPCTAPPGNFCPPGSFEPAGIECPARNFCPGATADKKACTAAAGSFCPVASTNGGGTLCPVSLTVSCMLMLLAAVFWRQFLKQ
jgi:hypothetical protein